MAGSAVRATRVGSRNRKSTTREPSPILSHQNEAQIAAETIIEEAKNSSNPRTRRVRKQVAQYSGFETESAQIEIAAKVTARGGRKSVGSNQTSSTSPAQSETPVVANLSASIPNNQANSGASEGLPVYNGGTNGCVTCGKDNNHECLLICEFCNAEYHIYCLEPPLKEVPDGDFYCSSCKDYQQYANDAEDDGLNDMVEALPPAFTSRFGEILWAQGGNGFGWWPACVYDPRLTVGVARTLAKKNLGKKHLVYFFECNDAPFTVLTDAKLATWEDGFTEEYDLGKAAKSSGKSRGRLFDKALQIAKLEAEKPLDLRMNWNHKEEVLLETKRVQVKKLNSARKRKLNEAARVAAARNGPASNVSDSEDNSDENRTDALIASLKLSRREIDILREHLNSVAAKRTKHSVTQRSNLQAALAALPSAKSSKENVIVSVDGPLYIKLLKTGKNEKSALAILGFIVLKSRRTSTFTDARKYMVVNLDKEGLPSEFKFYVPNLGPVSSRQESELVILDFLTKTTRNVRLGDGSSFNPLRVVVQDCS